MFPITNDDVSEQCKENIRTDSCKQLQFTNEDLPPANGFRGFEMLPKVICERIDITPYLRKQKTKKPVFKMHNPLVKLDVNVFLQQCSVRLVREDLEKLKNNYNNNTDNNKKSVINTSATLKKCKFCEKVYTSVNRLQNHVQNKHMIIYKSETKPLKRVSFSEQVIVHELKEYHHCRKCPKIYEDYQTLKTHMKQVHKKRKCYICFYCNKDFVDRMFFKVHIKMHCSLCGKFFVSKKMYNDHRRTVCRILKKYQCKTCNETYFSFLCLKDHSYDHEDVIYVCDICKEQFNSKCTLLHHIQFLHCKRRPKTLYDMVHVGKDILYECNSCDQCSNNKDIMENHTTSLPDLKNSIRTGYKDYYFCDQCSERFDTETKMLRHKWTHYLKANENNERREHVNTRKEITKATYEIDKELPLFLQPKLVLKKLKTNTQTKTHAETNTQTETNIHTAMNTLAETNTQTETNIRTAMNTLAETNTQTETNIHTENNRLAKTNTHTETNTVTTKTMNFINNNNQVMQILKPVDLKSLLNNNPNKPVIDPFSKRTILSMHRCEVCSNYFSTRYCLRRHIQTIHEKNQNLQCPMCEEVFVWPSLLKSHNCIRMNIPEMPFQDARPEIQFDNLHEYFANHTDMNTSGAMNISQDDVDFDMPAPLVELTEYDHLNLIVNNEGTVSFNSINTVDNGGYRIIMQEVPIEF